MCFVSLLICVFQLPPPVQYDCYRGLLGVQNYVFERASVLQQKINVLLLTRVDLKATVLIRVHIVLLFWVFHVTNKLIQQLL